jgi:hypothetical protein
LNYLLVNHIPAHPGADSAHLRLPAQWMRDLSAAGRVARSVGVRLTVATPLVPAPAKAKDLVDIVPDELGFEHAPIPGYNSARAYIKQRSAVEAALGPLIANADVVQLDQGGHPMPLGLVAHPLVHEANKRTLWVVSGDSVPDSHLSETAGTLAKRVLGKPVDSRIRHTLLDALREANAVVTTNPAVTRVLRSDWQVNSGTIEVIDVADDQLVSAHRIAERHQRLLNTDRPLRVWLPGEQTIDRGTDHALAAIHKCWKLRVPVELMLDPAGGELETVKKHIADLGLSLAIRWTGERETPENADVLLDTALCNTARHDLDVPTAQGLAPIAYTPRHAIPFVVAVARGDVDVLAEAIFNAATDRQSLVQRMLSGVEWARSRTLDVAYRQRFAIAQSLLSSQTINH